MKGRVGWMAMAVLFLTAVAHATTLSVTDIKVAQRYPWNGLVDITYTVNCDDPTKDVWVYPVGYDADKLRADGGAEVAARRHKRKDEHASRRKAIGCNDKAAGPEHGNAEARERARGKPYCGHGNERGRDVADKSSERTEKQHALYVFAYLAI